jgi:hypothetical protein
MKKNFANVLSTLFYAFGLLFLLLTISLISTQSVKAISTQYDLTYKVNSYLNVQMFRPNTTNISNWLTIGPAGWTITCNSGASCNYLKETWTATLIDESPMSYGCSNPGYPSVSFGKSATEYLSGVVYGNSGKGDTQFNLFGSGLYGAYMQLNWQYRNDEHACDSAAIHAWPVEWDVSGSIGQ